MDRAVIVELIKSRWETDSGDTISDTLILKHLKSAVPHVELDYNSGLVYTITNSGIQFSTEPTSEVGMLYVLKTLSNIQTAILHSKISSGEIGMSWRSGMDSASTTSLADSAMKISSDFKSEYKNALEKVKINNHSPSRIDLY